MATVAKVQIDPIIVRASQSRRVVKDNQTVSIAKAPVDSAVVSTKMRGVDVDTDRMKFYQEVTPATDGAQKVFTTPDVYIAGTLQVFVDQRTLFPTIDFTETTSTTFTMVVAPDSDEDVRVHYVKR